MRNRFCFSLAATSLVSLLTVSLVAVAPAPPAAADPLPAPEASASDSLVVWQGVAVVTTTSGTCASSPAGRARVYPGTTLRTVVRPRLLLKNGNDSRIGFSLNGESEFALDLAGGLTISGPGTYAAFGVSPDGLLKANVGGVYSGFALTPAAPTATTPYLKLTGTIQDFMFLTGCTVSFRAGYSLRS